MKDMPLPRVLPFTVFMLFIGIEGILIYLQNKDLLIIENTAPYFIYPLKTIIVACILIYYRNCYSEIRLKDLSNIKQSLISILAGLAIYALWIKLDFDFATQGTPPGFNPQQFKSEAIKVTMIAIRLSGATLLVPIMEELFWRSFLLRYVISSDFSKIPIGLFTWTSFLVTSVLFGLEHHYVLAGIMAGVIFNLLLYYTKSITQCILSHAVANLTLGIYVLQTGQWRFW